MKKIIITTAIIFSTAICSNIFAQQAPPPGAGDKDLRDDNVKMRSVELDKVERDAKKPNSTTANPADKAKAKAEDKLAMKYADIKTDYEQIQLSQNNVIKIYQSGSTIDYSQISKSAMEINKSAMRLHSNLFPAALDEKMGATKNDEDKKEMKTSKSVRDLIVDLDNSIGDFVKSPMFQNLRTADAEISVKTQTDLDKVIELSAMLGSEAGKKSVN